MKANNRSVCVAFDHENPEDTYVIIGGTPENMDEFGWLDVQDFQTNPSGVIGLYHDDENVKIWNMADSIESLKSEAIAEIKKVVEKTKDDIETYASTFLEKTEDVGQNWWEDEPLTLKNGLMYYGSFTTDVEKIWNGMIDFVNNTFIDGDSAQAWAVVDLAAREPAYCGGMDVNVLTFDDFKKWRDNVEEE